MAVAGGIDYDCLMQRERMARQVERARRRYRTHRSELLIALVVVVATGPLVGLVWAQSAPRYAFSAAVVEHHTVRLDAYANTLGVDRAVKDGHTYLDKAPGQPVLGVPLYEVYRLVGGESARVLRPQRNLGVWWQTLWCAALPAALLAVAMRREAARISHRLATPVALAMVFGSMLLPLGSLLFGHVLSAALGFAAFRRLMTEHPNRTTVVTSGALAGAAVTVEYTGAIVLVVLAVAAVIVHRARSPLFAVGAAVPLGALAVYQWMVFGGPFTVSYRFAADGLHRTGVAGMGTPSATRLVEVLFGERGFFMLTPLMLVGLVGLVVLLRDGREARARVLVSLAVVVCFLAFHAGWRDATGGDSPGPRYLVPAIPFLVSGVAIMWERARRVTLVATAIGAAWMALATLTNPVATANAPAVQSWLREARRGEWSDTIFTMAFGRWFLIAPIVAAAALIVHLLTTEERGLRTTPPRATQN